MQNIPNYLTLLRLVLIPVMVLCFYLLGSWSGFFAALVFCVASATDWLDGYLARRYQVTSPLGAFLDPVADKVLVATALILLVGQLNLMPITLAAVIIIVREIVVSALREWMAQQGARDKVAVGTLGKYKTAAQMMAIIALLWSPWPWAVYLGYGMLALATLLTVVSLVQYLYAARGALLGK